MYNITFAVESTDIYFQRFSLLSNHARPYVQSRLIVVSEIPSTSAASVSVSPARNRSSMTRLARGSINTFCLSAGSYLVRRLPPVLAWYKREHPFFRCRA
jgi:hypothetical protein